MNPWPFLWAVAALLAVFAFVWPGEFPVMKRLVCPAGSVEVWSSFDGRVCAITLEPW